MSAPSIIAAGLWPQGLLGVASAFLRLDEWNGDKEKKDRSAIWHCEVHRLHLEVGCQYQGQVASYNHLCLTITPLGGPHRVECRHIIRVRFLMGLAYVDFWPQTLGCSWQAPWGCWKHKSQTLSCFIQRCPCPSQSPFPQTLEEGGT